MMYPGIEEVISDNFFKSTFLENFFREHNKVQVFSPAYRPCANGQTERINRDLNDLIPQLICDLNWPQNEWSRVITLAAHIINSTPHSVTRVAPEVLHFGGTRNELCPRLQAERDPRGVAARMWKQATQRMQSAKDKKYTIEAPKRYNNPELVKDQQVWVNLNGKFVKAVVIVDYGDTVLVQKTGRAGTLRYGQIAVHKSRVSLRL